MSPNLPRWLIASCSKHFDNYRGTCFLHFEGNGPRPIDAHAARDHPFWAEFRLDGPYVTQCTKNEEVYDIEINVLLVSVVEDTYAYRIQELMGVFGQAFTPSISVFKYGKEPQDDDSYVGCLQLKTGKGERVIYSNFSQIGPNTSIKQGSIEGHYRMHLRI